MLINANALRIPLADQSVHCCITSPPYWGLRDYGTESQVWGGSADCSHDWQHARYYTENTAGRSSIDAFSEAGEANAARLKEGRWREDDTCSLCGAWRGSLGLEPTPDLYVAHMVEVFSEVWRVLRDDGTCWLNLGDSFATRQKGGRKCKPGDKSYTNTGSVSMPYRQIDSGLKDKDLVGIPWRVAFALQADGWYLRSEIVWSKPAPMPESVTDRPTKSHEQIFLLAKQTRYYYDNEAIKEPQAKSSRERAAYGWNGRTDDNSNGARSGSSFKRMAESGEPIATIPADGMRNKRSVWTVGPAPFSGAHFATFPPDLVAPMVLAGCPKDGIVLDPFCGSGTVGQVCRESGRRFVGIDLSMTYLRELALPRAELKQAADAHKDLPLFA